MDVILNGPQGSGKTTTIKNPVETLKTRKGKPALRITEIGGVSLEDINGGIVAEHLGECKPDVAIFDGCIGSLDNLRAAVEGVRIYRQSTGRDIMAIYAVQSEAVNTGGMLAPGYVIADKRFSDYPDGTRARANGKTYTMYGGYWVAAGYKDKTLPDGWDGKILIL